VNNVLKVSEVKGLSYHSKQHSTTCLVVAVSPLQLS
jgi:hypothetical protein